MTCDDRPLSFVGCTQIVGNVAEHVSDDSASFNVGAEHTCLRLN